VDGSTIQNIAYQHAPNWEWQGDDGIYVPYDSSVAMMLEKAETLKNHSLHHASTFSCLYNMPGSLETGCDKFTLCGCWLCDLVRKETTEVKKINFTA